MGRKLQNKDLLRLCAESACPLTKASAHKGSSTQAIKLGRELLSAKNFRLLLLGTLNDHGDVDARDGWPEADGGEATEQDRGVSGGAQTRPQIMGNS